LVVLVERLRPDARPMLRYFAEEGIAVKVISGDSPATVGAIAAALGLPGAERAVDGRDLPEDPAALGPMMEDHAIFGRVTPHQKRDMVRALQSRGHVVAMAGDGVNDVLAIKEADIGVAMGSGTVAARAVAEAVLLGNRFAVLPDVVAEGRRIIANIERLASLFITKTVYVALLAVAVGVARLPFPFYPRHLTIVSTLTIGVPAFFLALAPNRQPVRPEFLRRVLRFALPAGFIAALATFAAFAFATLGAGLSVEASRTAALLVLFGVGIVVLTLLILPLSRLELLLLSGLVGAFALLNLSPALRSFFAIAQLPPSGWLGAATLVAGSAAALAGVRQLAIRSGRE
ncbi:MAG: HAD-IC family P-type ATPase, partial [Sphingomonadales bacterium]